MTDVQMLLAAIGVLGTAVTVMFARLTFTMDRRIKQADEAEEYIRSTLAAMLNRATEAIVAAVKAIEENDARFTKLMAVERASHIEELHQLRQILKKDQE